MKVLHLLDAVRETTHVRDSTFKCWRTAAKPIENISVADVDKTLVNRYWRSQLTPIGNCSAETVRRRLSLLSGIWAMAIEEELIDTEINVWYRASRKIKTDRDEAAERYGKEYPVRLFEFYKDFHDDPLFLAIWYHGFRVGEIAGMLSNEIRFDNKIPYFQVQDNSNRLIKRGARRQVPIHPEFYPWVGRLETDTTQYPGKNWSEKLHEVCDLPKGEAAHSLRHNFITRARTALPGQDSMISKLVGHRVFGMTARYGTWPLEDKFEAIKKIRR